jgi:hypothetical protein
MLATLFLILDLVGQKSLACPIRSTPFEAMDQTSIEAKANLISTSEVTDRDFDEIINKTESIYKPIFELHGLKLKLIADWRSAIVNAYSEASGKKRFVYIYGGYARHPLMTKDAFQSVLCHEIGHHLGGAPREPGSSWASAEGEADYFSTLKCMKQVLKLDPLNEQIAGQINLPSEVKSQCRIQFSTSDDYFICLRSAKASEDYGKVNASLATPNSKRIISLLTPDRRRVAESNLSYPAPQCRVDTKLQGAYCAISPDVSLGFSEPMIGSCGREFTDAIGARPRCWFNPLDFKNRQD